MDIVLLRDGIGCVSSVNAKCSAAAFRTSFLPITQYDDLIALTLYKAVSLRESQLSMLARLSFSLFFSLRWGQLAFLLFSPVGTAWNSVVTRALHDFSARRKACDSSRLIKGCGNLVQYIRLWEIKVHSGNRVWLVGFFAGSLTYRRDHKIGKASELCLAEIIHESQRVVIKTCRKECKCRLYCANNAKNRQGNRGVRNKEIYYNCFMYAGQACSITVTRVSLNLRFLPQPSQLPKMDRCRWPQRFPLAGIIFVYIQKTERIVCRDKETLRRARSDYYYIQ